MPWQSHRVPELTQVWPSAQPLALAPDLTPMSQSIMTCTLGERQLRLQAHRTLFTRARIETTCQLLPITKFL